MTEKLKILKHHVEMIRRNNFAIRFPQIRRERIETYESNVCHYRYKFVDEVARKKHAEAINKASIAVFKSNFEEIPDFQDEKNEKQNYDLFCFTCPNYTPGKDTCLLYDDLWIAANR